MDIAATKAIERIARVLAGQRLSSNAAGEDSHAGADVDVRWHEYRDDAIAILKTLREPDEDMERAGDIAVWKQMIGAALGEAVTVDRSSDDAPASGTDPLYEGP